MFTGSRRAARDLFLHPGSRALVHDPAALDHQQLSGHKVAVRTRQKHSGPDDIGRSFDAPERPLVCATLPSL